MKKLLPIFLAVLAAAGAAAAQGQPVSDVHLIDTQKVRVPAPEGWTNVFPTVHWLAEWIAQGEKSGNVAAAAYVPDETAKKLLADERLSFDHYAKFTTPYNLLKVDVTPDMFAELAAKEVKKYPAKTEPEPGTVTINKRANPLDMIANSEVHLEYRRTSNVFSGFKLTRFSVQEKTTYTLMSMSMLNVKNRIILLYVLNNYRSPNEIDALIAFTNKWTDAIIIANTPAE